MGTLTVTDPAVVLGAEGDRIAIRRGGTTVRRVLAQDTTAIILLGPVTFTAGLSSLALRHGIDVVLMTGKGHYRGRLIGPTSSTGPLRVAQARFTGDPTRCVGLARAIVAGKIRNQRAILLAARRSRPGDELTEALARMRALANRAATEEDIDRIRGLEGEAAARYFGCFNTLLRNPEFSFPKRTRRPPLDPVNALLSFGYTILGIHAESALLRAGLEPSLGALHEVHPGRPSLMLDLIEEFRPLVVDALALRLVNRRQLVPDDFDTLVEDETDEILAGAEPRAAATKQASPTAPLPAGASAAGAENDPATASGESPEPTDPSPQTPQTKGPAVHLGPRGRKIFFRELARKLREPALNPTTGNRRSLQDLLLLQAWQMARIFKGDPVVYRPIIRL